MEKTEPTQIILPLGITLFSISIIIALFVLIISFKLSFHQKFSTELIIYVFISEIIFALTRYFFLKQDIITLKGTKITILSINLYTESVFLTSIVVHTIKIFDAIFRESQWFIKPIVRHSFRIFIFSFSAIRIGILIILQQEIDNGDIKCYELFCDLSQTLVFISLGIDALLVAIMLFFIFYSYCVLKQSLEKNEYYSRMVVKKIKKATCKVWMFPIATLFYTIIKVLCQILFFYHERIDGLKVFTTIIGGLKGAVYGVLLVLTQDTMKYEIKRMICCFFKIKRTETVISSDNEEREFEAIELTGGEKAEDEEKDAKS